MRAHRMVATAAVGLLLSIPRGLSAQGDCELYPDSGCGPQIGHHTIVQGGVGGGVDHGTLCYHCVEGGASVTPDHCHGCFFEEEQQEDDYALLIQAVDAGDVDLALNLAVRMPSLVHVNQPRSALQIESCDGSQIIAHIPLSVAQLEALKIVIVDRSPKVALPQHY